MFDNYKEFFQGIAPLQTADVIANQRDVMVSVAVLLVLMAQADGDLDGSEIGSVVGQMFTEFGLSEYDGAELLEIAQFLVQDGSKIDTYIEVINRELNEDYRQLVLAALWRLIIADGKVERFEAKTAADMRNKLKLSMEQGIRARKLAELNQVKVELLRYAVESEE